jgi:hypothetical protein
MVVRLRLGLFDFCLGVDVRGSDAQAQVSEARTSRGGLELVQECGDVFFPIRSDCSACSGCTTLDKSRHAIAATAAA